MKPRTARPPEIDDALPESRAHYRADEARREYCHLRFTRSTAT